MKLFTTTTPTMDGRRLDGYTISSPCEPNGSGELTIYCDFYGCKFDNFQMKNCDVFFLVLLKTLFEPRQKKTCYLHMRKQSLRSAARLQHS